MERNGRPKQRRRKTRQDERLILTTSAGGSILGQQRAVALAIQWRFRCGSGIRDRRRLGAAECGAPGRGKSGGDDWRR